MKFKPTKADLQNAVTKTVPDIITPDLDILFCGINPGLYTAASGHHYARPGNRFWPVLYKSGFTPRLLHPSEDETVLEYGFGLTNLVSRASARADELSVHEFQKGGKLLTEKVKKYGPKFVAFVGIDAYRKGFGIKNALVGRQDHRIGNSIVWVLPSTSGLNAFYQAGKMIELFSELRGEVDCS